MAVPRQPFWRTFEGGRFSSWPAATTCRCVPPVASTVLGLVEDQHEWGGPASDLLAALTKIAGDQNVDTKAKDWPRAAHALTKRLNVISTNLAAVGVVVTTGGRTSGGRFVRIQKLAGRSVTSVTGHATPATSTVSDDARDDASGPGASREASSRSLFPGDSDARDANDACSGDSLPRPSVDDSCDAGSENEEFIL